MVPTSAKILGETGMLTPPDWATCIASGVGKLVASLGARRMRAMSCRRVRALLAILLLGGLGALLHAQPLAAAQGAGPLVAPGLVGRAQSEGSVRVIVKLALPSAGTWPRAILPAPRPC